MSWPYGSLSMSLASKVALLGDSEVSRALQALRDHQVVILEEPREPAPEPPSLTRARREHKHQKDGTKQCRCGRTISANKEACLACLTPPPPKEPPISLAPWDPRRLPE